MNVAAGKSKGEAVDSFLAGKYSQVDVRKIEGELSKLWNQAAAGDDDQQVIRACSSNLILYTDRDDAETTDANMLDDVLRAHPARAILTIWRESNDKKLDAWVSARCHLASAGGSKQICSELITVLAEGEVEPELISVIESLLLGDLPTFLWWTVGELNGEKLGPFLSRLSRLIVDSSAAPYSFNFLRGLWQIVDSFEGSLAVADLNWRRLLGIRAAIAEEFERAPFGLDSFKAIRKVRISSCGQEFQDDDCSLQSMYFVGWLASRLGWEAKSFSKEKGSKAPTKAIFTAGEEFVEVEFSTLEMKEVAAGSIYEIEIELEGNRCLRVCRDPAGDTDSLVVMVKENGERTREVLAEDNNKDRVHLMGYELEDQCCDKLFAPALESAYQLLHLLEE